MVTLCSLSEVQGCQTVVLHREGYTDSQFGVFPQRRCAEKYFVLFLSDPGLIKNFNKAKNSPNSLYYYSCNDLL